MIESSMKPPPLPYPHAPQWFPAAAAAILTACALGCASPAPPHPPSLNLPDPVQNLTAERIGDTVEFHWTTPEKTTSKVAVKGPMAAEICRTSAPAGPCTLAVRLPVKPGPGNAEETLPLPLTSDPATLLTYRIQIFNAHNRSAGPSNDAFVASGAAPAPVNDLRAIPARDGVELHWSPIPQAVPVELTRLPVNPDGSLIQSAPKAPRQSANPLAKKPSQKTAPPPDPVQPTTPSTQVTLRTPADSTDRGGTLDRTAQKDTTYRYRAQRVRTVTLAGHTLDIRSPLCSPVLLTFRDIFPPRPPTGLEAVPGSLVPADRSIDLSWTPNSETDLAGYFVYRQDVDASGAVAATATRLNQTPVVGPAYRDQTAKPGHWYVYRVTAVDTAGNESPPSESVQETLREP
jgi:hypothetical protein